MDEIHLAPVFGAPIKSSVKMKLPLPSLPTLHPASSSSLSQWLWGHWITQVTCHWEKTVIVLLCLSHFHLELLILLLFCEIFNSGVTGDIRWGHRLEFEAEDGSEGCGRETGRWEQEMASDSLWVSLCCQLRFMIKLFPVAFWSPSWPASFKEQVSFLWLLLTSRGNQNCSRNQWHFCLCEKKAN